jgi:hypothetical protein
MRSAGATKLSWGGLDPASLRGAHKLSQLTTQDALEEYCHELAAEKGESWKRLEAEIIYEVLGRLFDPHQHTSREAQDRSRIPHSDASDEVRAELAALRNEISRLKEEQRRELADLRAQLQKVDRKLGDVNSPGPGHDDQRDDATKLDVYSPDPYRIWLKRNRELLKSHPNSFVAIDLDRGIILSTVDESEFVEKLRQMPDPERERLLTIHTSAYV